MDVKCYNKKCLHTWDYKGKDAKFVCCPKCRFKRLLCKCRSFFLSKSDIPTDRPTNIPNKKKESKPQYRKVIEKPKTDFIQPRKDMKEVSNFSDFHLESRKPGNRNSPIEIKEVERDLEIEVIPHDPIKHIKHMQSFF